MRGRRSLSVPPSMHASAIQEEHRAPRPHKTIPALPVSSISDFDDEVNKHPWAWLLKHVRIPRSAGECVACPPNGSTVDVQVLNAARLLERSVGVSVLIFELFVTSILLSNGIVWFWFGTWAIYDLWMTAMYGSSLTAKWQGLLTTLAIGLTLLVAAVLISRTALADYIYQPVRPRTWKELVLRTVGDRCIQFCQACGGIAIWRSLWEMWTYFILPDNLWGRALTAHFVGLVILLLTFSFRSAVTPPMVFIEDSILAEQLGSRWNLVSKFIVDAKRRRELTNLERDWEESISYLV